MATGTGNIKDTLKKAAELDKQIKGLTKVLEGYKTELVEWYERTNQAKMSAIGGASVTFVAQDVFNPIDISTLRVMLEMRDKLSSFDHVVKADITALREVLGADDVKELQGSAVATKISVRLSLKEGK